MRQPMQASFRKRTGPSARAYALTIFLSAFLLFHVQPLMGEYLLP